MTSTKQYDLEDRTLEFSKRIIRLGKTLEKKGIVNEVLIKQAVRSGTSPGANYRETNEALSKKDFVHKIRISRKEAKENMYWLELIIEANPDMKQRLIPLRKEAEELKKIFSTILDKSK